MDLKSKCFVTQLCSHFCSWWRPASIGRFMFQSLFESFKGLVFDYVVLPSFEHMRRYGWSAGNCKLDVNWNSLCTPEALWSVRWLIPHNPIVCTKIPIANHCRSSIADGVCHDCEYHVPTPGSRAPVPATTPRPTSPTDRYPSCHTCPSRPKRKAPCSKTRPSQRGGPGGSMSSKRTPRQSRAPWLSATLMHNSWPPRNVPFS